jgi:hypothetical protein
MRYTTRNVAPSEYSEAVHHACGSDEIEIIALPCSEMRLNILDSRISETWSLLQDSHRSMMVSKPLLLLRSFPQEWIGSGLA